MASPIRASVTIFVIQLQDKDCGGTKNTGKRSKTRGVKDRTATREKRIPRRALSLAGQAPAAMIFRWYWSSCTPAPRSTINKESRKSGRQEGRRLCPCILLPSLSSCLPYYFETFDVDHIACAVGRNGLTGRGCWPYDASVIFRWQYEPTGRCSMRGRAVSLSTLGCALLMPALLRAADDEPSVQGRKAADWLLILRGDASPQRRRAAVIALEIIGPKVDGVVAGLGVALKDSDASVRKSAGNAQRVRPQGGTGPGQPERRPQMGQGLRSARPRRRQSAEWKRQLRRQSRS